MERLRQSSSLKHHPPPCAWITHWRDGTAGERIQYPPGLPSKHLASCRCTAASGSNTCRGHIQSFYHTYFTARCQAQCNSPKHPLPAQKHSPLEVLATPRIHGPVSLKMAPSRTHAHTAKQATAHPPPGHWVTRICSVVWSYFLSAPCPLLLSPDLVGHTSPLLPCIFFSHFYFYLLVAEQQQKRTSSPTLLNKPSPCCKHCA